MFVMQLLLFKQRCLHLMPAEGSMSCLDCALGRTADGLQISAFHQQKWIWLHQFYSLMPNLGGSVYADLSKYYIKHLDEWVKLI